MKRIAVALLRTRGLIAASMLGMLVSTPSPGTAQCGGSAQCVGDANCDGRVTVDELVIAVNNALHGCPMSVGADQACTDFATTNCTKLDQCVFNGTTVRYGGATTCRNRQRQVCLLRLGATGTGNSPADVEECVSEVPSSNCNDFDLNNISECEARIGSAANGAPCAFPGQCASSNCAIVAGTNCGTCAAPNQAGDSCATTTCSHGFRCVASTQLCQPIGSAGNVCDADHPCGVGLSCVTPAATASGLCQVAGSSEGVTCDPKHQSAPGCDGNVGLYCSPATNLCAPITYVTAGAPCGVIGQVVYSCTNASTCFGAQGSTPGTCVADATDGMPCTTQTGPSCVPPAQCVTGGPTMTNGTCRFPDPTKCS